ncbi:helix-turn-helix domain-containing protein [Brucella anthropi]|uniref:helix-turn-helix domain-containing protein n=1 Tax=Brucella anthropi TaxID=529 RepID=UPI001F4059EC|nr:helix-turn-helix transcriptional regulator [Brucella anthropi]
MAEGMEMRSRIVNGIEVTTSSGNVFTDLGLPDAEKLKIKADLVIEIMKAMRACGLNQQEAGRRMGLPQQKVSTLLRGDFANISVRKLKKCLDRLSEIEND